VKPPAPQPSALRVAVLALGVLAAALAARHLAIEPAAIAHACDPAPWSGACALRSALILGFVNQALGWFALASGALATLRRGRWLAALAVWAGAAGLVLYSVEPAAVGALLGMLVLARSSAPAPSTAISPA